MTENLLIAYARNDLPLMQEIKHLLEPLQQQGILGNIFQDEIRTEEQEPNPISVRASNILLLLVSPDFLNTDYCYARLMKEIIEKHQRRLVQVIPIILRPVYWNATPFSLLPVVPSTAKPITTWQDPHVAFSEVVDAVLKAVDTVDHSVPRHRVTFRSKNILLIGAQGSGKGTQADLLVRELGFFHLASGNLFRKEMAEKTELSVKAKAFMDRGELVPDEVTISMVLNCIKRLPVTQGVLLDGFPRTISQAKALDSGLQTIEQRIDLAIYLEVPREELLNRLSGRYICQAHQHVYNIRSKPSRVPGICDIDGSDLSQRSDDTGEAIHKRLDIFFAETIQLLDYYDKQHKLASINGNQGIHQVQNTLLQAIELYNVSLTWNINIDSLPIRAEAAKKKDVD